MATSDASRERLPLHWPMIGLWSFFYAMAGVAVWRFTHVVTHQAPGFVSWSLLAFAVLFGVCMLVTVTGRAIDRHRYPNKQHASALKQWLHGAAGALLVARCGWQLAHQPVQAAPGFWLWLGVFGGAALALGVYTSLGVTVGYHRGFTHRGFKTGRFVTANLLIGGGMVIEGPAKKWIEIHLGHHANADEWDDPHSPYRYARVGSDNQEYLTMWGLAKGLFWSHLGWMFVRRPLPKKGSQLPKYLNEDPLFTWQEHNYVWLLVATFLVPTLIGAGYGLATGGWGGLLWGALDGLLIPGFLRVVTLLNITWSINSICHVWGGRAQDSQGKFYQADNGRNIRWLGWFSFGESMHANHHAQPKSAFHGWDWYDPDPSKWAIWTLERFGLVKDVARPRRNDLVFKPHQLKEPRVTKPPVVDPVA